MSDLVKNILDKVEKQSVSYKELCEEWERLYKRMEITSLGWESLYHQAKTELEELKNARSNDQTVPTKSQSNPTSAS